MNFDQAIQMMEQFKLLKGFSVSVEHHGFYERLTDEVKSDGQWRVELRCTNVQAGTHTLTSVENFTADARQIKALAANAKGNATKREQAVFAQMRAEKSANAS